MLICDYCKMKYTEDINIVKCERCEIGTLEKAVQCKKCKDHFHEYDLVIWNYCEDCFNDLITIENCLKVGNESKEEVKINSFLALCFTPDEIEETLKKEIKNSRNLGDYMKQYVNNDRSNFIENIEEDK